MKINLSIIITLFILASCNKPKDTENTPVAEDLKKEVTFQESIISDDANLWWARSLHDVDGDGILDIILQDNNGFGGWLGYLKGDTTDKKWEKIIIAETSSAGKKFAAGDLDAGDLDNDGDIDIIGVEHPGEWADADADAILYWYENATDGWVEHSIGTIPSALKDISIADLDNDKIPEIITVTYNAETLSIFHNDGTGFKLAWELVIENLHEGMDVGDVDGDQLIDIAANGYWLPNPGNLNSPWELQPIDSIWFNQQDEHWSRNATKVVCEDTDNDGKSEVFITHSEKAGYPVAKYDWEDGVWSKEVLMTELQAAHNLQVIDVDLDGNFEVLSGINTHRATDIAAADSVPEPTTFPVVILSQNGDKWEQKVINQDGCYNLLTGDLEGDGDIDIIRLTTHDAKDMWLMKNQLN